LDDAVAQVFGEAGLGLEAEMARSFARIVGHFDEKTQNRMSRLDVWLLRQPDPALAAREWRNRFLVILDKFSGGELLRDEDE
jgi:hypothetical protein